MTVLFIPLTMAFRPISYVEEMDGKLRQHVTPRPLDGFLPSKYNIMGSPRLSKRRVRPSPVHYKGIGSLTKAPVRKPKPPKGARQIFKSAGKMQILRARNKHRDILRLFHGDSVIYSKHDHNFLVTTGFLAVVYNDNYPALRFVAYIHEEYKDFELKFEFEEALPVKAIAQVADWPALVRVIHVLVERIVIVDNQLVLVSNYFSRIRIIFSHC